MEPQPPNTKAPDSATGTGGDTSRGGRSSFAIKRFDQFVDGLHFALFLACDEETGAILGSVEARFDEDAMRFRNLYVDKAHRRVGAGTCLLIYLQVITVWEKKDYLSCVVKAENRPALEFYHRHKPGPNWKALEVYPNIDGSFTLEWHREK